MNRAFARLAPAALICLAAAAAHGQEDFPTQLHTIKAAGVSEVGVGDLVQVRFRTQATAAGISRLRVEVRGESLRKVATVTAPLDPSQPQQPGGPFFLVAMFKAEAAGDSAVTVVPLHVDGTADAPFRFTARVRPRGGVGEPGKAAAGEIPAPYRGVWTGRSVSKDKGKTVELIDPIRLTTAYATKVRGQGGDTQEVVKAVETKDDAGNPGCLILLADGTIYGVTKKLATGDLMLQTMRSNPPMEVLRFGFTIAPE